MLRQRPGQIQRLFNRQPLFGPVFTMPVDLSAHLLVGGLRRRHKDHMARLLGKLLRVTALAAARTTKHECHRTLARLLHRRLLAHERKDPWSRAGINLGSARADLVQRSARMLFSSPSEAESSLIGLRRVS